MPESTDPLAALIDDLRRVPELFEQLDVTITRTDVMKRPTGDFTRGGGNSPLLLNDRASDRRRSLLRALRLAAAQPPLAVRALSPRDAALVILRNLVWTSRVPGAEQWISALLQEFTRAWGVVDARPDRSFAGKCEHCGTLVYGPGYLRVLRCPSCGGEHRAALARSWMAEAAEDYEGTAAELARMLPEVAGAHVRANTISKWHERGHLDSVGYSAGGPTFRLGDVLELHRARRAKCRPVNLAA